MGVQEKKRQGEREKKGERGSATERKRMKKSELSGSVYEKKNGVVCKVSMFCLLHTIVVVAGGGAVAVVGGGGFVLF